MVVECQLETAFKIVDKNPRFVSISANSKLISEVEKCGKITEIYHSSGVSIKTNQNVIIKDSLYKINKIIKEITEDNKSQYRLINYELSKTSQFILPLLGLSRKELEVDTILCNAFIGYRNRDYGKYLYLLYRCDDEDLFNKVEDILLDLELKITTEYSDESFCLLRLEFPKRFNVDIQIIIQGKYSKISEKAKFCILEYYKAKKNSSVYQILYKTKDRKYMLEEVIGDILPEDAELFSTFDEREIYN